MVYKALVKTRCDQNRRLWSQPMPARRGAATVIIISYRTEQHQWLKHGVAEEPNGWREPSGWTAPNSDPSAWALLHLSLSLSLGRHSSLQPVHINDDGLRRGWMCGRETESVREHRYFNEVKMESRRIQYDNSDGGFYGSAVPITPHFTTILFQSGLKASLIRLD